MPYVHYHGSWWIDQSFIWICFTGRYIFSHRSNIYDHEYNTPFTLYRKKKNVSTRLCRQQNCKIIKLKIGMLASTQADWVENKTNVKASGSALIPKAYVIRIWTLYFAEIKHYRQIKSANRYTDKLADLKQYAPGHLILGHRKCLNPDMPCVFNTFHLVPINAVSNLQLYPKKKLSSTCSWNNNYIFQVTKQNKKKKLLKTFPHSKYKFNRHILISLHWITNNKLWLSRNIKSIVLTQHNSLNNCHQLIQTSFQLRISKHRSSKQTP